MDSTTGAFERTLVESADPEFVLRLYVAGTNSRSLNVVDRVTRMCERHLADRYELRVVDIYQHPTLAEEAQVIAVPNLVRLLPAPVRRIVGDMADEERTLRAIGVAGSG